MDAEKIDLTTHIEKLEFYPQKGQITIQINQHPEISISLSKCPHWQLIRHCRKI